MTKAYIYQGRSHKNVIIANEEADIEDLNREDSGYDLIETCNMYESDIEKVNDFFIELEELSEAYHHMSPAMQAKFAKLAGEKVLWNFSCTNLTLAGLRKG